MQKSKSAYFYFVVLSALSFFYVLIILKSAIKPAQKWISPIIFSQKQIKPIEENKKKQEIFGFAPYWNLHKLKTIDFKLLTTLAYFGIEVSSDGSLVKNDPGYEHFICQEATELFEKAHASGTRVVLTLTQMKNPKIEKFLDNPQAQEKLIDAAVDLVKKRGIDGINVDFEYVGDPGEGYRRRFSNFVQNLTQAVHAQIPSSQVTVSVYASAIKDPKIYDIASLANSSDGIFMMAYDFAVAGSDHAIPTAPLYGYKEGKYWYDVATAVEDFLSQMPAEKLILGVPWYGYDYAVYRPEVKAVTRPYYSWRGTPKVQTLASAEANIIPDLTGWDNIGKVAWKAYYVLRTGTWRMVFLENKESLALKYDFIKKKNLGGVGMWALGYEGKSREYWNQLHENFAQLITKDANIFQKKIEKI